MNHYDCQILQTLHQTNSISKTAALLYTTQPTLTKKLQQLENEFHVTIAIRSSKGITFTPEGEYLIKEAGKILAIYQNMKAHLDEFGLGQTGTLYLGMTNSFERFIMGNLIVDYQAKYKDVIFDIATGVSDEIISLLNQNKIHVGFIRGDVPAHFEKRLISVDQAYAVYHKEFTLQELPHLPQVNYLKDSYAQKLVGNWWNDYFDEPAQIGLRANHGDTCRELIIQGAGYGIFLTSDFLKGFDNLYKIPLYYKNGCPLTRSTWTIWKREYEDFPLIQNFISYTDKYFDAKRNIEICGF